MFAGTGHRLKRKIGRILEFPETKLPFQYLGLLNVSTRLRNSDFRPLLEAVHHRLSGWTGKFFSYAGRAELIRSTLLSMQVYWCSAFKLLKATMKALSRMLCNFFWSGPDLHCRSHPVAWDSLCRPMQEGGMGIRRIEDWNKAGLLKQFWALGQAVNIIYGRER